MRTKNFRAHYRNGVLEPLEPIDLTEDEEVLLTVAGQTVRPAIDPDGLSKSAGV